MKKFFTESIPEITNNEELQTNIKNFPNLDAVYVATASIPDRKNYVNDLWETFSPYADTDFIEEAKRINLFYKRSWEMYLGATLVKRGYNLQQKKAQGPDLKVLHNDQIVWIEATAPDRGVVDSVPARPDMKPGIMYSGGGNIADENRPKLLRILSAVANKSHQYQRNLELGYVASHEPYIIAINGHGFSGLADLENLLVKWAFFGLGLLNIRQNGEQFLAKAPTIEKYTKNGKVEIETGIFTNDKYSHISGAVFSSNHIINTPKTSPGSDLIFVKNNYAKNPVPDDFWQIGREWINNPKTELVHCKAYDSNVNCSVY